MLTALAAVLAIQFQNATLARFPDAVLELAVFALAHSTFSLFAATLNFTPQLANLFARNIADTRTSQRFVLVISLCVTLGLLLVPMSSPGRQLLQWVYGLEHDLLNRVCTYLIYLSPLLLLNGQRLFINGQLEQARLTGWVTVLNTAFLSTTIGLLATGFFSGWPPAVTLCGAQLGAATVHLALGQWIRSRYYELPDTARRSCAENSAISYRELLRFFLPITATGVMFALSRPVLYAFVARTPDALVSIAALRVAFDFSMLFQQAANQFRSFWVTFGLGELQLKRRFMWLIGTGLTATMLLIAATPLNRVALMNLLGVEPIVFKPAVDVLLIMCCLPAIIIWRNYYHGFLMVTRNTNAMALGSSLRVVGIALVAALLGYAQLLNHVTAALTLLLGFAIETLIVGIAHGVHRSANSARINIGERE